MRQTCTIIMVLFFIILFSAQTVAAYGLQNVQEEAVRNQEIVVSGATLDQAIYAIGDSVTLSFTVENTADTIQAGLQYRIDVVGGFTGTSTVPTTRFVIGEPTSLPLLQPGETYDVETAYTLPTVIASRDSALRVVIMNKKGETQTFETVRVLLTGTPQSMLQYIAQIQVDGQPFSFLDAPTIYKGETAAFAISFARGRGTLTPTVGVYDGATMQGAPISETTEQTITLRGDKSVEQRIVLPSFSYRPGVYTAVITYTDVDGVVRAGPFEARYVVAGMRPLIDSVLPTTLSLTAQQSFDVVARYQAPPRDIQLDATYDPAKYVGNVEAEVRIVDAHNMLIGSERVAFLPGTQEKRITFVAPHTMYGMRIITTLYEDGVVCDTRDELFPDSTSLTADTVTSTGVAIPKEQFVVAGIVLAVLILVAGVVVVRMNVKKRVV